MTKQEYLQNNGKTAFNFGLSNKLFNYIRRMAKNRRTTITALINSIIDQYSDILDHQLIANSKENYKYHKCGNNKTICVYLKKKNKALLRKLKHNLEYFSMAMVLRTIIMDYLRQMNMEGRIEGNRKISKLKDRFNRIADILIKNKSIIKKTGNGTVHKLTVYYEHNDNVAELLIS